VNLQVDGERFKILKNNEQVRKHLDGKVYKKV